MWFTDDPDVCIGMYRVFGCPCVARVHTRKTPKVQGHNRANLTSKNIIQRGVRGIFIGFLKNQAGWELYIPSTGTIKASVDVAFDENFTSEGLAYNKLLF